MEMISEVPQQAMTNIDYVYEKISQDSGVVDYKYIETILKQHQNFNWEEYNKSFRDIDFNVLCDSLDFDLFNSIWAEKQSKSQKPKKKSPITSLELKEGSILSIGCSDRDNCFIIKNVMSGYASHPFTFDSNNVDLLQKPLDQILTNQLEKNEYSIDYSVLNKLQNVNLEFNLFDDQNKDSYIQSKESMDQLKCLALISYILNKQVKDQQDTSGKMNHKPNQFIKSKYNEKTQIETTKLSCFAKVFHLYNNQRLQIVKVNDSNKEYDPDITLQVEQIHQDCKTITQFIQTLSRKQMDIVVQLDNCSIKKENRDIQTFPKLKIKQIVLRDSAPKQVRKTGLNFQSFINK